MIYAMSDIHGCIEELQRQLEQIDLSGENHYYINGSVYKGGKLLLLVYDEEKGKYYQVENRKMIPVRPFDKY